MALLDSNLLRLNFDLTTARDLPIAAVCIHVAVTGYTCNVLKTFANNTDRIIGRNAMGVSVQGV